MSAQAISPADKIDIQGSPLESLEDASPHSLNFNSDEKQSGYYEGLTPDIDLTSDYYYEELEVSPGALTDYLDEKEEHREGSQYYTGEQNETVATECVVEEGQWTYKVTNAERFVLLKKNPTADADHLHPKIRFKNGHVFHVTKRITVSNERCDGGTQTYLEADRFGGWLMKFHQMNGKAIVEEFEGFSYYEPNPTFDQVGDSTIEYDTDIEVQEPYSESESEEEEEEVQIVTHWACTCCPGALNEASCPMCGSFANEYCFPTWETVYCCMQTNAATNEPIEKPKLEPVQNDSDEKPESVPQ